MWFVLLIVEFVLPMIPIFVSCMLSVNQLRSPKHTTNHHTIEKIKRNATLTITLLTIVFIVFNVPMCVYFFIDYISICVDFQFQPDPYFLVFITTHTIALNSLFNTILYFTRMRDVRTYISGTFNLVDIRQRCAGMFGTKSNGYEAEHLQDRDNLLNVTKFTSP